MGKAVGPLAAIVFGGFIAELLVASFALAAIAAIGVVIAVVVTIVMYVKCLREAAETDRTWLANLLLSPLVGSSLGYLAAWLVEHSHIAHEVAATSPTAGTPYPGHPVLAVVMVVLIAYGVFIAPFLSPAMLMTEPGGGRYGPLRIFWPAKVLWAMSWPSFAVLGFVWGGLAIENIHL